MRQTFPAEYEHSRREHPTMGGSPPGSMWGCFAIDKLTIISSGESDGGPIDSPSGWEHVSVSTKKTPTWGQMKFVKNLFWLPEETVVRFHPPESVYVNEHEHVLHLWRHPLANIPLPPLRCV